MNEAIEKINDQMQKNPNDPYTEIIGQYIIDRITQSNAENVLKEDRTLDGVLKKIKDEAKKQAVGGCAVIKDSDVYKIVDEYFEFEKEKSTSLDFDFESFM